MTAIKFVENIYSCRIVHNDGHLLMSLATFFIITPVASKEIFMNFYEHIVFSIQSPLGVIVSVNHQEGFKKGWHALDTFLDPPLLRGKGPM